MNTGCLGRVARSRKSAGPTRIYEEGQLVRVGSTTPIVLGKHAPDALEGLAERLHLAEGIVEVE